MPALVSYCPSHNILPRLLDINATGEKGIKKKGKRTTGDYLTQFLDQVKMERSWLPIDKDFINFLQPTWSTPVVKVTKWLIH